MRKKETKSVMKLALWDIDCFVRAMYNDSERFTYFYHGCDNWICTSEHIYTKETIRLNRLLGLHKINKQNNIANLKQIKNEN